MSTSLEYHHVSQFYQTVLFFLIPLLTVQSIYICIKGITSHYQEAKLKEIKRWEKYQDTYQVDASTGMEPQQMQNVDPVRLSERRSMREIKNLSQPQLLRLGQVNQQFANKQQFLEQSLQQQRKNHNANTEMEKTENQQLQVVQKVQQEQHSNSKIQSQHQQIPVSAHIASMISTQEKKQQEHPNYDIQNQEQQKQQKQQKPKEQTVNQQQMSEQDEEAKEQRQQKNIETALNYAFKIDQIFDYYMPIIVCIIVLGILTQSVFIFSMFCFFCFLFSTLLFNYADVITRLKEGPNESSFLVRINYLLSGIFIFILFISFWAADEYQV